MKVETMSEEDAKESNKRLNWILDSSLGGIAVLAAVRDKTGMLEDLQFTTVNATAEKLMQRNGPALVGRNLLEAIPEVISSGLFEKYCRVIEQDITLDLDYLQKSESPFRWYHIRGVKMGDGLVLSYIDITERKDAEENLRVNEEHLRLFIDAVDDCALLSLDPKGHVVSWNLGAERIKGYKAEDIIGRHFSCFYLPEAIASGHPDDELRIAASKGRYNEEGWRVRKDGSTFLANVVITAIHDSHGVLRGFAKVTRDITKARQSEDQLRSFSKRLELATKVLKAGVWDWDIRTNAIEWDERMYAIYGMNQNKPMDYAHWAKTVVPEDLSHAEATLQSVIASKSQASAEFRIALPNGALRYIQAAEGVVLDNAGQVTHVIGVNIDATERKEMEQKFLRAQRVESIGTLAGGIAHDLNNILAPIVMSIHILKETAHDEETKEILDTIEDSALRGADIVRQVLSFARGVDGERVEVAPKRLLQDLANIVKNTFPKDIHFQVSMPEDTWNILGDATQVHQILLNLCLNARDAMPNGGTLAVEIENCALDEQYAAMNLEAKSGPYIYISVTDTGRGIPPESIDKIFEPFFTTKDLNKGTGLGLSTVAGLVKSHDGIINVFSEIGKGTTFRIYLPAAASSSETQRDQANDISPPRGNGETVLLVDDEASVLSITRKTLQASGYRVLTATDGANALAVYLEHKQDIGVVLTDMMMPIMEGPALIHALMRINPSVKIIAASGLAATGRSSRLSETRVKHFLAKPYTAESLLKTLSAILVET